MPLVRKDAEAAARFYAETFPDGVVSAARLPLLRSIGAAAIFATFIPSALVYYHLIPAAIESAIAEPHPKERPRLSDVQPTPLSDWL